MNKFEKGERCALYDLGKRSIVTIVDPGVWIYTVKNSDDDTIDVHIKQLRKLKKKRPEIYYVSVKAILKDPPEFGQYLKVKVLK